MPRLAPTVTSLPKQQCVAEQESTELGQFATLEVVWDEMLSSASFREGKSRSSLRTCRCLINEPWTLMKDRQSIERILQ